jgi:hypothetical protein
MTLSTKILIWLGAILLVGALGFIIYTQIRISSRQDAIEQNVIAQKQLVDGIVRSQATWATRDDVEKYIKDNKINLKAIQDDLDKLHADVTAVNITIASSTGQHGIFIPTKPGPVNPNPQPIDPNNPDPFGYLARQQNLDLNEEFSTVKVPLGTVGFSAWQEKPWSIDIKARDYKMATVVGTDENQRMYFYNKFTVSVDNKDYEIPIKTATTQQVYPEAKFSWFNPRLYLGADGTVGLNPVKGEFIPSANIQIMSYGRYKTQPDFSILQVGAGYGVDAKRPQLVVTPVSYNIGKHIPLMNNLYLGPSLSVGTDGNVGIGGGIRVGL